MIKTNGFPVNFPQQTNPVKYMGIYGNIMKISGIYLGFIWFGSLGPGVIRHVENPSKYLVFFPAMFDDNRNYPAW